MELLLHNHRTATHFESLCPNSSIELFGLFSMTTMRFIDILNHEYYIELYPKLQKRLSYNTKYTTAFKQQYVFHFLRHHRFL